MDIEKGLRRIVYIYMWFSSKKSAEAAMEVGAESIFMVNTNTKVFCKETIDNLTKDWSGGYYVVLSSKPMVPGGRPRIAIRYEYNTRKVLYYIVTDNLGIPQKVIPYLSKYPDQLTTVSIRPDACPLFMSVFFCC